ncbi:MAG TPA: cytochrome P450 [Steroidobacteraceae bacterium]|jgi:hypothetical protein|nr:cytochrome P450 [Steroidobacteraceae bacterium]
MRDIPAYDVDIFSEASVRNARSVDDALREAAPVARLVDGTVVVTRYADVAAGLTDWKTFSSASRPWHDPNSVRPEILVTDDPPRHTRVRPIIGNTLGPRALEAMRCAFEREAVVIVDDIVARSGQIIDAVGQVTRRFVFKVLPDLIGLPDEGRENMTAFGHMVWATFGPPNELYEEAVRDSAPVVQWLDWACERERLSPQGVGAQIFAAADEGRISAAEAKLLVQTVLAAGSDTSFVTMAATIGAFARFPEQYQRVRADLKLVRNAFDECLRWDSPSRLAGRITTREVQVGGCTLAAGQRTGLLFAAANRDPRAWDDPLAFDVGRDVRKHMGFGYGTHACVGRALAQVEAIALLTELARRIERIEIAGEEEPWITTIGHGPARLPVRFYAA